MFNRRMVLAGVGSTGLLFSAPFVSSSSAQAAGFDALFALYDAVEQARFRQETARSLSNISRYLSRVDAETEQIFLTMKDLPHVMRKVLEEDHRRQLKIQIASLEQEILDEISSQDDAEDIPQEHRDQILSLATQQSILRGQLYAYGPVSYPFVARAFASEALALRALGREQRLFDLHKANAAGLLSASARDFAMLATQASKDNEVSELTWDRLRGRRSFYIGSSLHPPSFPHMNINSSVIQTIRGSYESGAVSVEREEDGLNAGGWPMSPFLGYRTPRPLFSPKQFGFRTEQTVAILNRASRNGLTARTNAAAYSGHSDGASRLAARIGQMRYV